MTRKKLGKGSEMFSSPQKRDELGDAPTQKELKKVHILLTKSQIQQLDQFCLNTRMESDYSLKRTEILRALVDVFTRLNLSPTSINSEEMLKDRIVEKLDGGFP